MNIYEREGEKGLVELERKSIYVDILENLLAGVVVSVLLVFFFGECFSLSLPDNETWNWDEYFIIDGLSKTYWDSVEVTTLTICESMSM